MEGFKFTAPVSTDIFDYTPPVGGIKGLVSIPHCGLVIPDEFKKYISTELTQSQLNEDVDFAVDQLVDIAQLSQRGIAVLVAKVHRVCVDLNRSPDVAVFAWKENSQGIPILAAEPTPDLKKECIEKYYNPYFAFMNSFVKNLEEIKLGFISLLDLHSMPSKPTAYHLKANPNQSTDRRKDFCVSNLQGQSCQRSFIQGFCDQLAQNDWTVSQNDPYLGGYITQYMDKEFRCNVLQSEINRDLYMNEAEKTLLPEKVTILKPQLTQIIIDLFVAYNTPFVQHQIVEQSETEKEQSDQQFAFAF